MDKGNLSGGRCKILPWIYINQTFWNITIIIISSTSFLLILLDFVHRQLRHPQRKTALLLPSQSVYLLFPFLVLLHQLGLPVRF